MPPQSRLTKRAIKERDSKKEKKKPSTSNTPRQSKPKPQLPPSDTDIDTFIDLSTTLPLTLQQLLLNVFKSALLTNGRNYLNATTTTTNKSSPSTEPTDHDHQNDQNDQNDEPEPENEKHDGDENAQLDTKTLIQTIKSHLYNRNFDSAFTDANEELLRAYALRWSSSRALGYAGIFRALWRVLPIRKDRMKGSGAAAAAAAADGVMGKGEADHVVCIGGGAGAEIVALAAAWRDWVERVGLGRDGERERERDGGLVEGGQGEGQGEGERNAAATTTTTTTTITTPKLSVTAVDIADWSGVVDRLAWTIQSPAVPGTNSHPAPLYRGTEGDFQVNFQRLDVLSAAEKELQKLFAGDGSNATKTKTVLVTLMFTLNELFSTSMAKTTGFLLKVTELLRPGTVLLVVDSPGSYSTLKLGKSGPDGGEFRERQYPMKFLLDHTLLSVAEGKWERLLSQDSRWWRRDAARLRYEVGEGAGLEDMRFQVHVYRRLEG
ncbi:hypothetical protein BO71DRAFT_446388 [Aspergillus ellipticus CBS 707.79]|uniref:25S rRNA (Uridine(2843)-N(3))-methyltransferase n=1 Tax=Aspergillus ellipticus CBS 707.79 TaxID=1448320 RepID=A0A319DZQ1_9EURO|nr:hypothetical protein BO71DRAFT_446388 [Aspergillus ellipticus CBS 707.79]